MRKKNQLPEEIVEEILVRLQVVYLLRFKSVCKLWHRMISDAHFIRRHLEHSKANPSHHRILTGHGKYPMESIDCGDLFNGGEAFINDLFFKREVTVLGTCDGLVCYFDERKNRISVWNPATRMRKSLRTLKGVRRDGISFHWFGHESDDDAEYKLVIGTRGGECLIHLINPFSDEHGWKSTHEPHFCVGIGALFNRRVHWVSCHLTGDKVGDFVVFSFDLRSQTVIEIPGLEGTEMHEFTTMCVTNGCLSAIGRSYLEDTKPVFEVWVMKEYGVKESWTKLTTISFDIDVRRTCFNGRCPFLWVAAVTDKGDLIVTVDETGLMVCNIAEGKSRKLMMKRKGIEVMYVVESLVFPSGVPVVGSLAK